MIVGRFRFRNPVVSTRRVGRVRIAWAYPSLRRNWFRCAPLPLFAGWRFGLPRDGMFFMHMVDCGDSVATVSIVQGNTIIVLTSTVVIISLWVEVTPIKFFRYRLPMSRTTA
ncbi:hypothetical protein BDP55DRAFT_682951 [Colletotrichum godetiae]|uniref:Uncharacterized protein n=1 Tax=Colletotrichum godetiae TaxID=1209918 RepID=A0AAJ0EP79_9PEZI|nr:uncharacterized protein BDP55DRAFT_682951 [Colletotrichum godetiae]KAK1658307.1 hypothetical protein BDP55DRAFT_682951 [Colletotrichum godetiae]